MKALLTLLIWLTAAVSAWSCSCMPADRDTLIAQSDAAFRGRVLRTSRTGDVNMGTMTARVLVLRGFKGVRKGRVVKLRTGANSAMCGVEFRRGETVSLVASKDGRGWYRTGLCSILP